jgi:hypothetical protein
MNTTRPHSDFFLKQVGLFSILALFVEIAGLRQSGGMLGMLPLTSVAFSEYLSNRQGIVSWLPVAVAVVSAGALMTLLFYHIFALPLETGESIRLFIAALFLQGLGIWAGYWGWQRKRR